MSKEKYSAEFKAKVAIEAIKGEETTSEIVQDKMVPKIEFLEIPF